MKISTRGQYALEAALCLAANRGSRLSTREISERTGISAGYLEQLFIPLKRDGVLDGARGPRGGYLLARDPEKISAGDVLRSAEQNVAVVPCVKGEGLCAKEGDCIAQRTWVELDRAIAARIDSVSLADLARAFDARYNGAVP